MPACLQGIQLGSDGERSGSGSSRQPLLSYTSSDTCADAPESILHACLQVIQWGRPDSSSGRKSPQSLENGHNLLRKPWLQQLHHESCCNIACMLAGHSMGGGLAAVAAGSHPADVTTAFLMDPVDWNFESNRVDSQYLTRYIAFVHDQFCQYKATQHALTIIETNTVHSHLAAVPLNGLDWSFVYIIDTQYLAMYAYFCAITFLSLRNLTDALTVIIKAYKMPISQKFASRHVCVRLACAAFSQIQCSGCQHVQNLANP